MKSINISDELHKRLKLYSVKNNVTVTLVTETAIRDYIAGDDTPPTPNKPVVEPDKRYKELDEKVIDATPDKRDIPFT